MWWFFCFIRNHGSNRNHRLCILFGVSIGLVVFIIAEDRLQLAEVLHRSAIAVDTWLPRWPLHVCAILDVFVWNGSRLLVREFTTIRKTTKKKKRKWINWMFFNRNSWCCFILLTYDNCSDSDKKSVPWTDYPSFFILIHDRISLPTKSRSISMNIPPSNVRPVWFTVS